MAARMEAISSLTTMLRFSSTRRAIRAERAFLVRSAVSYASANLCASFRSRLRCSNQPAPRSGEGSVRAMRKIRSGDNVVVISGKNKGQTGKVRLNLIEQDRVVVEGVNIVIKHIKRGRARQ